RHTQKIVPAFLLCAWILSVSAIASADDLPNQEGIEFFEKKIRPILVDNCYECHSAKSAELKGNLHVDSREGLRRGGATGPAVVPGDLNASLLMQAVKYSEDSYQMPPKGKLPDEIIHDLEQWIEMGAPDPRDEQVDSGAKSDQISRKKMHWSFQAPRV